MTTTHTVENQPPPLVDANLYAIDRPLMEGLAREGGAWGQADVAALGVRVGSAAYQDTIRKANANDLITIGLSLINCQSLIG